MSWLLEISYFSQEITLVNKKRIAQHILMEQTRRAQINRQEPAG